MSVKVVQFNNIGKVTFSKNRQSKRIKISVKPDSSVRVSYPYYCTSREVANFLSENEKWIVDQQRKIEIKKRPINEGDQFQTKRHIITIRHSKQARITRHKDQVTLYLEDIGHASSQDILSDLLNKLYLSEAKSILPERLHVLAEENNFQYNKVSIRNNRRSWGSCSAKNNISLNLQLMKMPDHLIDYVLLHELVHTEIKNHGPVFWSRLNQITNFKARQLAAEVKKYSTYPI